MIVNITMATMPIMLKIKMGTNIKDDIIIIIVIAIT